MIDLYDHDIYDKTTKEIFNCIVKNGTNTRRLIQQETGFSWGSVSNSTKKLMNWGLISLNKKKKRVDAGRKPSLICVTDDVLCVGADVSLGIVTCVVATMYGKRLFEISKSMNTNDAKTITKELITVLDDVFNTYSNRIKGVGIAVPSITTEKLNRKIMEYPYHGDFIYHINEIIENRFLVMTDVYKDPECLLAAEMNSISSENIGSLIVLRWSYGIGLSMVIDNKLHHGYSAIAGEIGHVVIDSNGPKCSCGKSGCLETYSSLKTILDKMNSGVKTENFYNIEDVLKAYKTGNSIAKKVLVDAIDKMSIAIANTINIIDPRRFIIGGELSHIPQDLFDMLLEKIRHNTMKSSKTIILKSRLDDNAPALGATFLIRDRIYSELYDRAEKEV